MNRASPPYRWATPGDINAFFGLALDNLADLVLAVRTQLERCGVGPANIDAEPPCTYADRARFFSYRRDGARSGRLAAIIAPHATY